MLFDLGGKRKRFIQVIYVCLALLLGGGLVLFGIGGDAQGGLFDAIGISDDGTTSSSSTFENQIDNANEALAVDPEDQAALLRLSRYQFLAAQEAREQDEQGQVTLTAESLDRYGQSVDAWERYLDTDPQRPDDDVAGLVAQAYQFTIDTGSPLVNDQLDQLVVTAQIVAEARPSYGTFLDLTTFAYIAGNEKVGAEAAKSAKAEAADETQEKQVNQVVKQAQSTRTAIQQQTQGSETGAETNQLPDPTAGLGGAGSTLPPPAP